MLRAAEAIDLLDRAAVPAKRIGSAGIGAEEAQQVADRGMAEAQHQRIAGGVVELVDPADLEAVLDEDVGRRRHHDLLVAAELVDDAGTRRAGAGEGVALGDDEADCSGHSRFSSKRLDAVVS